MGKRLALYGVNEEALQLLPLLLENSQVEIAAVWAEDREEALERARALDSGLAEELAHRWAPDAAALAGTAGLEAVIDAGCEPPFQQRFPAAADRGLQVVTPLMARLLWGYGGAGQDHKGELLQALHEVVESYNLTVDPDELFRRMLEIALSVTGADGGSLMLLDERGGELRVRVAVGLERELWPKIRVPLGEGIAGHVAQHGEPLHLRGKADRQRFRVVRERMDVESALCMPLDHEGRVLGVLNLHHTTQPDAFSDEDVEFAAQLAALDAQIIARAQEQETLRSQAARYAAVHEVRELLGGRAPLVDRLTALCRTLAEKVGSGIATIYLREDPEAGELRLAATSLEGGGFAGEYRVGLGQGIDGRAAASRQPVWLRGDDGALAYAALPLLAGGELLGILCVQVGGARTAVRGAEETFLEISAAVADEIAQSEREARMHARATRESAINEAGIRMVSATDPAEVVRLASSSATMILEADHAVVRLQDERTGRYVIRSYFGSADGRLQERLFRLDKRVSVDVIKRRSAFLLRDLDALDAYGDDADDFRSALAAPLKRDGQVIGTLCLYDKVAPDRFYAGHFNADDLQTFSRFVSYVERALANSLFHVHARQHRNFDEETGLPNEAYLSRRIHEELARTSGREAGLALGTCRIENLEEIARAARPAQALRVVRRTAEALRAHLRDFDVLGRAADGDFVVIFPEPGFSPDERVFAMARAVADDVSKDDALNDPVRVCLAFGYAVHPGDGADRETLLTRASIPRIRMV
jgi:GAF domain-containing protein